MHLRRAVLLMAVILVVVAIVGALVPVPRERSAGEAPRAAPGADSAAPVRALSLRYPPKGDAPRLRVRAGTHVVLQVGTSESGQASVKALDLVAPAEPDTPARFDLLASRPGRYPVAFQPAAGGAVRTVGTITVASSE
jgi:hypothetical protein